MEPVVTYSDSSYSSAPKCCLPSSAASTIEWPSLSELASLVPDGPLQPPYCQLMKWPTSWATIEYELECSGPKNCGLALLPSELNRKTAGTVAAELGWPENQLRGALERK